MVWLFFKYGGSVVKTIDFCREFIKRSTEVSAELENSAEQIAAVIDRLYAAWCLKLPVFIIGNGGSASTASHLMADLVKTVVEKPGDRGLRAICLADNPALMLAIVNDWGADRLFDAPLATFWEPGSVVIAISVNGGVGQDKAGVYSQNLIRALQYAKNHSGWTIGLVGDKYGGGEFRNICDQCVIIPDGATPQVESFHVLVNHLITFGLKQRIRESNDPESGKIG